MDESIDNVSTGTPTVGADASPSAAPTLGGDSAGATPPQSTDGSTAAPQGFQVPPDDSDLQGRESQPYIQGLLQTRQGFRELHTQHQQLQQEFNRANEVMQQVEQIGGPEVVWQSASLVAQLFQPQVDELGQVVADPYTGLPVTTSEGFVQTIAAQNWDTALDMTEHLLSLPTQSGEPLLAEVMRRVLGLDPQKLDLYRQISSPADAAARGLLDVSPAELQVIPADYHNTYQRLNQSQREWVLDENLSTQQMMQRLEDYREHHRLQDIAERNEQMAQAQMEQQAQQWAQQVEQRGDGAAVDLWNTHAGALMNELGQIQWSDDQNQNSLVQNFIAQGVAAFVENDPSVAPLREQAYELVKQAERYRAQQNTWFANRAALQAQQVANQVAGKARIRMTHIVQALQSFRGMASQAANGANGARPVITANGQGGPGSGQRWQPSPGTKLLSPDYFEQLTGGK